jgi:hypothetical protein
VRYTYKIPSSETVAFQASFQLALAKKITPRWLRELLGTVFFAAIFLSALWITEALDRAVLLTFLVWLIHWLWQRGFAYIRRKRAAHYLGSLAGSEDWTCEVTDSYFVTENRGTQISFPLSGLTRVFEEKGFVYLDFEDRGRARIPVTAFSSVQDRENFVASLSAEDRQGA